MKAHFEMFAAYNAWANRRLYAAVELLSEADFQKDLGAFFGSLRGTLNHLVIGDLVWMARFTGGPAPSGGLDGILYEDLAGLWVARQALDSEIIDFISGVDPARLEGEITYSPITLPEPVTQVISHALAHFFNHQTHHRGQAHALLTRLTGNAPPLDLLYYQREAD